MSDHHFHNHMAGTGLEHPDAQPFSWRAYALLVVFVGILLLLNAAGLFTTLWGIDTALLLALLAGYKIIYHALLDLLNRRLSSHLAIVVAALAAIAAKEYLAAAEAMFIMLVGEGLEHYTVDRARRAISGFVRMTPVMARVRRNGEVVEVLPEQVQLGETVVVRAGEKIPVDGIISAGQSSVNESLITGEPIPAHKSVGDLVYSGSINEYGLLEVRAEKVGESTVLARIGHLITEAQKQRAPIERTADVYARFFLPAVLLAGGAIYYFTGQPLRAVAALIVACPCALVLATPAAVAAAIGRLAREGVLVKGGSVIEALARIRCVAFDKTGTLTAGRPSVHELVTAAGTTDEQTLVLAAAAELSSEHLLGREIVAEARRRGLAVPAATDFAVRPGMGVQARVSGRLVRVGNLALVREALGNDISWIESTMASHSQAGQTAVAVTADDRALGVVSLRDPLRTDALEAIIRLKEMGMTRLCLITGDAEATAQHIGRQVGIGEIYSRLLPEEKAFKIREIRTSCPAVLMVGDGINDSPSLAVADVGIAMGRGAADISAEAAHVVFLKDRLMQIPDLIAFTRKVIQRIRSSILWFAFGANFLALLGAAFGYLGPVAAAAVHQAASLFVILNCIRLLVEGKAVEEKYPSALSAYWRRRAMRLPHRLSVEDFRRLAVRMKPYRNQVRNWSLGLIFTVWVFSGIAVIAPEQHGVLLRFGGLAGQLDPGLHFRWPWPVESVLRIAPHRVQAIEIGYRTILSPAAASTEPPVYGWNIQHREGRYRKVAEEALMLTGDENLVEVNAVVQFTIQNPAHYLFRTSVPETLIRAAAEQALRLSVAREPLDTLLTSRRSDIEAAWKREVDDRLKAYGIGLAVVSVRLQDVHPPLEVVDAFRDVASALEERSTLINEAEGYLREQVPLARGKSQARILAAQGYSAARIERSVGESARFAERERAYRLAQEATGFRLYLETMEQVLPAKPKYIVDAKKLRQRRFVFADSKDMNLLNLIEPRNPTGEPPK